MGNGKPITFRAPENSAGFGFYHTSSGKPLPDGPLKEFYETVLGPIHKVVHANSVRKLKDGKIKNPKYPEPTCIHDEVKAHAEQELRDGKIIKFRF